MSKGPLAGLGVIVTRPADSARDLAAAIEAAGGNVISFPAIDIIGREQREIAAEMSDLPAPNIVVFVSRNAVLHGLQATRNSGASFAAVGPATRDEILRQGVAVDIFPDDGFDSEHLLQHNGLTDVDGSNVLIVRGQGGRELLAETLRERGANVDYLRVYDRRAHTPRPDELANLSAALENGNARLLVVMSANSVASLVRIVPAGALDSLRQVTLVAPSTRVLQTASELIPGIETALASGPQAPDIVDTLIRLAQSGQDS